MLVPVLFGMGLGYLIASAALRRVVEYEGASFLRLQRLWRDFRMVAWVLWALSGFLWGAGLFVRWLARVTT